MQAKLGNLSVPVALGIAMATGVWTVQAASNHGETATASADSAIVSEQTVNEQKALIFAAAGRNAVGLVESARYQLARDKTDAARIYLERAGNILGQVHKGLESEPRGAGVGREDADVIAIYAQLGVADQHELSAEVRAELEALSNYIVLGEHEKVIKALERIGVPIVYRYVEMSVGETLRQVETALAALDAQDTEKANKDLLAATALLKSGSVSIGLEAGEQTG